MKKIVSGIFITASLAVSIIVFQKYAVADSAQQLTKKWGDCLTHTLAGEACESEAPKPALVPITLRGVGTELDEATAIDWEKEARLHPANQKVYTDPAQLKHYRYPQSLTAIQQRFGPGYKAGNQVYYGSYVVRIVGDQVVQWGSY